MHEFGISLRLWMMVFMVSRLRQNKWKGFKSMEPNLESFGLWLENWIWKVKKENGGMS